MIVVSDIKYPIRLFIEQPVEKWNSNEIAPFFNHLLIEPEPLVEFCEDGCYDVDLTLRSYEDLRILCTWLWPKEFHHITATMDDGVLWINLCFEDGSHISEMNCI